MHKRISAFWLVLMLFLTACVTINVQQENPTATPGAVLPATNTPEVGLPPTSAPGLSEELLRNSEFLSPAMNVPIRLVDGEFSGSVNGVELKTSIRPGVQFGDLNDDGVDDAALLLSENMGGTGTFVSLVVIFSQDGKFKQAPGITIDDRPVINSIAIGDNKVKIDVLVHGPNDPMVNPTQAELREYTLVDETLILTKLNSILGGGTQRTIEIDTPAAGEEIGTSVRVSGSMAIAPFENTLLVQLLDNTGKELYRSAFMVTAADIGQPATFDNTLTLPALPSGLKVILVLQESSMADGSPLTINSVILKTR